jgi:tRNA(Arg) A34 adenosine deaminase TadA
MKTTPINAKDSSMNIQLQAPHTTFTGSAFPLPDWVTPWLNTKGQDIIASQPGHAGFMKMVIELSRLNFQDSSLESQNGGPFAAAVVHKPTGEVISIGVNRVIPLNTSIAHAEIIALAGAQQQLGQFTLKNTDSEERPYTLYTSAQMCAMCLGAVCWSGIGEVVFGAKAEDTERLTGFDEGPIHPQWRDELQRRNIKVVGPVLAEQANHILQKYKALGKTIYAG